MELTVQRAAEITGGKVVRGDANALICRVLPVDKAAADAITFVSKAKFVAQLASTRAAAVLADPAMLERESVSLPDALAVIHVSSPYVAFARIAQALAAQVPRPDGVHASAVVEDDATIGDGACVGPFVYVGAGARVGEGAVLYPGVHVEAGASVGAGSVLYNHVVVRHQCHVGERCILHPGVVIGADGFGFAQAYTSAEGAPPVDHVKIPQVGDVVIEDDVEIGANSCVDRGTLGTTRIGAGTKIDNLVQVGHNVEIGPRGILVAQCGVAGSSKLGTAVTLGAQSGISGHVELSDGAMVYGQSGVMQNVEPGATVCGTPSVPAKDFFRNVVRVGQLSELSSRVKKIERRLDDAADQSTDDKETG